MGQRTNPIGLRIPVNREWRSKWYASKKDFGGLLAEDARIRSILKKKLEKLQYFETDTVINFKDKADFLFWTP